MKRVVAVVAVVFATAVWPAAAGIRPADQKLSERLTLVPSDFPSGWTTDSPASTRLERTPCPTAPEVEGAITGYSDSAGFVPIDATVDRRAAGSTTRVFSSPAVARSWYSWAGGAKTTCDLKAATASWRQNRPEFVVSRLRHRRESFALHCPSCPPHQLIAWRWGFTIFKHGQNDTTYLFDTVVVRIDRAVASFTFLAVDMPFGRDGVRLVSRILKRA